MLLKKWPVSLLLFSLPFVFLLIFYCYPLVKIIIYSFLPGGTGSPGTIEKLFSTPTYGRILWFTIWQAAVSTVITLVLALPGAYIFAKFNFFGKNFLQALMTVPFVLPTVVTAAAFRALLGSNGLVNSSLISIFNLTKGPIELEQTVTFFLIAHVFYNYTMVLRIVASFWSSLDPSLVTAARMLGASPLTAFRKITLPLLLPAIGSAALLVFIFCFTSFGVVLILGGPGYATIEVEIYRQAVQLFNLPMAAALSLVQICFNFLLMWLHARLSKKSKVSFFSDTPATAIAEVKNITQRIVIAFNITFMLVLLVLPLLALIISSFMGEDGFTLTYYRHLFAGESNSLFYVSPISSVVNSIGFALTAMLFSLILGITSAVFLASGSKHRSNLWDAFIMLPLATSAVTLGFGYIITLNAPPLNLRDSLIIVPIAHTLVAFPFVVRCVLPGLRQIPENLREAACLLGASPFKVWRLIDFPLIKHAILVGAIFAFSISMGEFGASAFLTRPHTPTMPVAIFRFLSQPGELNYGQAMAMSCILMLVTCSSFWIIGRFSHTKTSTSHT
ncbi:MAG: thiamine transport system permease protein [Desulforhopalus sp.]|jgi:thiamine transport system permease protein